MEKMPHYRAKYDAAKKIHVYFVPGFDELKIGWVVHAVRIHVFAESDDEAVDNAGARDRFCGKAYGDDSRRRTIGHVERRHVLGPHS